MKKKKPKKSKDRTFFIPDHYIEPETHNSPSSISGEDYVSKVGERSFEDLAIPNFNGMLVVDLNIAETLDRLRSLPPASTRDFMTTRPGSGDNVGHTIVEGDQNPFLSSLIPSEVLKMFDINMSAPWESGWGESREISKEEAWNILESEENVPVPEKFVANSKNWKHLQKNESNIWTYQFSDVICGEGNMKVLGLHYIDEGKFPFMFIFQEYIGVDRLFGGRERYNHDHKRSFTVYYFDPKGKGRFVLGEHMSEKPHYFAGGIFQKLKSFDLESEVKAAMRCHPDKIASSWAYGSYTLGSRGMTDYEMCEAGLNGDRLFETYNNTKLVQDIESKVTEERKARHERVPYLVMGDDPRDYEPSFSLRNSQSLGDSIDIKEVLFNMLEMTNPEVSYR